MAKSWTAADGYLALKSGDKAARTDIGRRFPLFATSSYDELAGIALQLVTARKLEAILRDGTIPTAVEDETEETEEETTKVEAPARKTREKAAAGATTGKTHGTATRKPRAAETDDDEDDETIDFDSLFDEESES